MIFIMEQALKEHRPTTCYRFTVEVYNGYFEGFSDNLFTQVLSLYIQ